MDTPKRTLLKAVTWQALGLLTMSVIGWWLTGSLGTAGGFALLSAGTGFVMFFLHERLWSRITWGLAPRRGQ